MFELGVMKHKKFLFGPMHNKVIWNNYGDIIN